MPSKGPPYLWGFTVTQFYLFFLCVIVPYLLYFFVPGFWSDPLVALLSSAVERGVSTSIALSVKVFPIWLAANYALDAFAVTVFLIYRLLGRLFA